MKKVRLYQLYRELGISWKEFKEKTLPHGHQWTSPQQVIEEELIRQVKMIFAASRLAESEPEEASNVPGAGKVRVLEPFWTLFEELLEDPERMYREDLFCLSQTYFVDAISGEPLDFWSLKDPELVDFVFDCLSLDYSAEEWGTFFSGLGIWDEPANDSRCWVMARELLADPSIKNLHKVMNLQDFWAKKRGDSLAQDYLQTHLQPYKEKAFEDYLTFLHQMSEDFAKIHHHKATKIASFPRKSKKGITQDGNGGPYIFPKMLERWLKKTLISWEVSASKKSTWTLKPHLWPSGSSPWMIEEWLVWLAGDNPHNLSNQAMVNRAREKKPELCEKLEKGFRVSGLSEAKTFGIGSNHELTCCGSDQCLIELPSTYLLFQFYRFC